MSLLFDAYPTCKPSGINWLGDVSTYWKVRRRAGAGGGGVVKCASGSSGWKEFRSSMGIQQCILCGRTLTSANSDREHTIPNAIGGRKTVTEFICRSCNNKTGTNRDAELAGQLQSLSLLLGIKRQQGDVKPKRFPTSSGGEVELHVDGKMTTVKPSHEITTEGNTTQLKIRARSTKELRKLLRGWQRKYPALKNRSMADLMSAVQTRSYYSPDLIDITLEFGGEKSGRSLVKSAMSLVFDAGIDPRECNLALDYLTQDNAQPCFGYSYDKDRDLVVNRPVGRPFHCVYVKGDSNSGTILGYVELYSLQRMVLCLSDSYSGRDFQNLYAIDPVKGEEILIDIDLSLPMSEIRSAFDYEKYDIDVRLSAVDSLFGYVVEENFKRERERVVKDAVASAIEDSDAEPGEDLSDDQAHQITEKIMEKSIPFIQYNAERFLNASSPPT